jgi:hypothetical protein
VGQEPPYECLTEQALFRPCEQRPGNLNPRFGTDVLRRPNNLAVLMNVRGQASIIQTQAFSLEIARDLHYREALCDAASIAEWEMPSL